MCEVINIQFAAGKAARRSNTCYWDNPWFDTPATRVNLTRQGDWAAGWLKADNELDAGDAPNEVRKWRFTEQWDNMVNAHLRLTPA